MIRVFVEGGLEAMFAPEEEVTVCMDVIDGQYIVNESYLLARELLSKWSCGEREWPFIFLNGDQSRDAPRSGIICGSDDIFKIERVTA
jgi:hypothetical protein